MKKLILVVGVGVAAVGLWVAPAGADASNGAPSNCVGQTTAYVVRGNPIDPFISARGLGNVARANDASTRDAANYIKTVSCGL